MSRPFQGKPGNLIPRHFPDPGTECEARLPRDGIAARGGQAIGSPVLSWVQGSSHQRDLIKKLQPLRERGKDRRRRGRGEGLPRARRLRLRCAAGLLLCRSGLNSSHYPWISVLSMADTLLSDRTSSSSAEDTNVTLGFLSFLEMSPNNRSPMTEVICISFVCKDPSHWICS